MARTLPPEVTRGTLEGTILPGDVTLFRLHGTPDGRLSAYIAQGEVLDAEDGSFGSRGIIAVPDMGRFTATCCWSTTSPTIAPWPSLTAAGNCTRLCAA